jgi:Fe2+ transport system protein B
VFLPQILILFAFILLLEASGYMVRAAFLMDRLMSGVGLSGRSFIPLLSSFACAIPGIMATRSVEDPKERLVTILIAPLMTCSARLPVYAVIIGAFIPAGRIASVLEVALRPIGFNHEMSLAVIPAMAAREVAVSSLQTVYAIDAEDEEAGAAALGDTLGSRWSLPTALAFLAWFVFAPQCLSTIAVIRRETNGWKWPAFTLLYLFVLAYVFAGITYWTAVALGL